MSILKQNTHATVGIFLEGLMGIEPMTRCLKGSCSTTELQAQTNYFLMFDTWVSVTDNFLLKISATPPRSPSLTAAL